MKYDLWSLILLGFTLGLPSGLSPGPILALTISETLKHGTKEGLKVAFSPLITDVPIIVLSVFILSNFSGLDFLLGVITLSGASFLLYLAYKDITRKESNLIEIDDSEINSLKKAVITNFLNANPYIFWMSIGGPILIEGYMQSRMGVVFFLISFYFFLIISKVAVAVVGGKLQSFFRGKIYLWTIRGMGVLLLALAVFLFFEGFEKIGL